MPGSGENRRQSKPQNPGAPPTQEQEQLPCPRCDSTNTKFCYYNNYNFSQPRHFCKSCRRYWTHGGTLRDIPVGGGTRKNAKRSRTISSTVTSASSASPMLAPVTANQGASMQFLDGGDVKPNNGNVCGSFTSLLHSNQVGGPGGFLSLGGFGFGFGFGLGNDFEDVGFGMGRAGWAFPGLADGAPNIGVGGIAAPAVEFMTV